MKKIFFTILVAVMTINDAQAGPEKKGNHKDVVTEQKVETSEQKEANEPSINGEETYVTDKVKITSDGIVVKDDEGNDVRVNINDLNRIINEHLDDTVLSDAYNPIEIGSENVNAMANRGMDLAEDISRAFFTAIVCIVFFSLLFYYLHRRRKYKTVDRAIQAGYPLPDEFFGKRSQHVPQQPTTVYVTQVTPPEPNPNAPYDAQTAPGAVPPAYGQSNNPLNNITDWAPFKKGFRITAWGLGLLLFFWIVGATPVAALMIIVVFIGLGKLFVAYQEQQNLKNQWQQQQWTQQPQQNSQQQWQQWNPQQQPNNVPPMPETPPEFDPNK
jgi:archaellum component FlaF (FlaF/FlaG flagellin family)